MQAPSTLEMESLVGTTIGPIAELGRIRAEWEIVDLVGGTCTSQVFLFPDEAGTGPKSQLRYWCHTSRVSSDDGTITIFEGEVCQGSETKDIRIRSKSTPSRLRGDAKPYVPRRAISLEHAPLTSTALTLGFSPSTPTLLANDLNTSNSVPGHSSNTTPSGSPTVHISFLLDTNMAYIPVPESPRTKHISAFETLSRDSELHLNKDAPLELRGFSNQPRPAKKQKLVNPYVNITRQSDYYQFSAKYTAMPLYWITVEPQTGNGAKRSKKPEAVGPYRSAAMWEFVGQTFAKHERRKKLKATKNRKAVIREFLGRATPRSKLSQQVLAGDDKDEAYDFDDIRSAWTDFVNSADDLLDNFSLFPEASLHEMDLGRWQEEDRRGRRRSRGYDPYTNEQGSSFSSTGMDYNCEGVTGTEVQSNKEKVEETGLGLSLW